MKIQAKIKVSLLDFIKNGQFDYIKLGQSKEWILNNFPDPDDFSSDYLVSNCTIWRYGNIEFHFDKSNELILIYTDYLQDLTGGESLELDKWILEAYSKLNLAYVITKLNEQEIDYCKSSNDIGVKITTQSGVCLSFAKDFDDKTSNPNQLQMTSLSLSN